MSSVPFTKHRLDNGLEIVIAPTHDAPVASFWVAYRVGSRNETPGLTGISHWVEHMLFKGTERPGSDQVMRQINREGGTNNAFTSKDFTAYHETLPSDRLDLAIEIESDRMLGARFDADDVETERTVILSERQGYANHPSYRLWELTESAAFAIHPYRYPVIGYESDLKSMTRDELYDYYRRYYHPGNAVVIVTGDVEADALLAKLDVAFGSLDVGPTPPPVRVVEPAAEAMRRVELRRPAPAPEVLIGLHAPDAEDDRTAALAVLSTVLSGAGGRMGKSSRLYRSLVASGKATSAWAHADLAIDPTLFLLGISGHPGGETVPLEELLLGEVETLKRDGVTDKELSRAKKQLAAAYRYGAESVTGQAEWLTRWAMLDTPERSLTWVDELQAVTADEVVACLDLSMPTIGHLIPTADGPGAGGAPPTVAMRRAGINGPGAPSSRFDRRELVNGAVLLSQAQPQDPTVAIRMRIPAGAAHDPSDKPGLANLTAMLTHRGTRHRSRAAFDEAADNLGAAIGVSAGRDSAEVAITCLAEDLEAALDLAIEAVRQPAFDETEIDRARAEVVAAIAHAEDQTASVAERLARESLYPEGHPAHHSALGTRDSIQTLTRDDLVAFHGSRYVGGSVTVAAAGGFQSADALSEVLEKRFDGWMGGEPTDADLSVARPEARRVDFRPLAGKQQADLCILMPLPAPGSDEYDALELANSVLGQLGMMGRLGERVREQQGMAYYTYSAIGAGRDGSVWTAKAGVDPKNVAVALASILDEVATLRSTRIEPEELEDAQRYLTGVLPLRLETNHGIARLLLTIEYLGLGLDYVERYPGRVRSVTLDRVLNATSAWIDPDRVVVGIAGPPESALPA